MKNVSLLVWLTQLGLSVALPLAGFVLLGFWLHSHLGWGVWTVFAGLILGLVCAVQGFRDSLKAMELMAKSKKKEQEPEMGFITFDNMNEKDACDKLRAVDINTITPIEALNLIFELKKDLD